MVTEAKPKIKSVDQINPNLPIDTTTDTDLDEDEENGQPLEVLLDPELQPEQPIPDNAESQEIFKEHRRLAMEYLKVNTNLYYAQDIKEKILVQMDPAERQEKQELLKKLKEKVSASKAKKRTWWFHNNPPLFLITARTYGVVH